jgi:hypothetical protein
MAAPRVSRPFRRWGWHGHVCPPQECRNIPAVLRIDGNADNDRGPLGLDQMDHGHHLRTGEAERRFRRD